MTHTSIHINRDTEAQTEAEVTRWNSDREAHSRLHREEYVSVNLTFGPNKITVFMTPQQYAEWKQTMRKALLKGNEDQQG